MNKSEIKFIWAHDLYVEGLLATIPFCMQMERTYSREFNETTGLQPFGTEAFNPETTHGCTRWLMNTTHGMTATLVVAVSANDPFNVLGFAVVDHSKVYAHMLTVFRLIAPKETRYLGITEQIVDELLDWAQQCGCRQLCIHTTPENTRSVEMYEGFGFKTKMLEMTVLVPERPFANKICDIP